MGIPYKKKKRRKKDWQANHAAIRGVFLTLFKDNISKGNMFPPTNRQIAEITGLSENTVSKHIEDLDMDTLVETSSVKLLLEPILMSMAAYGMKGDHNCARLFIDNVSGGNVKRVDLTSKGERLPTSKTGDTFNIIAPEWKDEVEALKKDVQADE